MLSLPLKELLSLNISTKYGSNKNKDANKEIIESILKEELNESPIIKLLNMTFEEWIDIFTMKNQFDCNIMFNGLETTLMKILSKNDSDDKYFTRMIFYLYNYPQRISYFYIDDYYCNSMPFYSCLHNKFHYFFFFHFLYY